MDEQPKSQKTNAGLTLVYDEERDEPDFKEVLADKSGLIVETLYEENLRNVPTMLRSLADEIEEGEYGNVSTVACVVLGDEMSVFGWGAECDPGEVHLLLTAGATYMVTPIINKGK